MKRFKRTGSDNDKNKDKKTTKQAHWFKNTGCFWLFKDLSQETEDLMIELEDTEDDLDNEKLIFKGSNGEKFNFNTFKTL